MTFLWLTAARRRRRRHRYNAGNFPNHDAALAGPRLRQHHQYQLRPRDLGVGHISRPAWPRRMMAMMMTKIMMMMMAAMILARQLHVGLFCPHFCGCCRSLQLLSLNCCCSGWKCSSCFSVKGARLETKLNPSQIQRTKKRSFALESRVSSAGVARFGYRYWCHSVIVILYGIIYIDLTNRNWGGCIVWQELLKEAKHLRPPLKTQLECKVSHGKLWISEFPHWRRLGIIEINPRIN